MACGTRRPKDKIAGDKSNDNHGEGASGPGHYPGRGRQAVQPVCHPSESAGFALYGLGLQRRQQAGPSDVNQVTFRLGNGRREQTGSLLDLSL